MYIYAYAQTNEKMDANSKLSSKDCLKMAQSKIKSQK